MKKLLIKGLFNLIFRRSGYVTYKNEESVKDVLFIMIEVLLKKHSYENRERLIKLINYHLNRS